MNARFGYADPTPAGISSDGGNQSYFNWFSQQYNAAMNNPNWSADMDANYGQPEVRSLADECTSMMANQTMKTRNMDMMQSVKAQSRYEADLYSGACASVPGAEKRAADALDSLQAFLAHPAPRSPSCSSRTAPRQHRAPACKRARASAHQKANSPNSKRRWKALPPRMASPNHDIGAQATYQWSYAYAMRGLELLKPDKACMGPHHEGNRTTLIGIRDSSKSGCEALASTSGACPNRSWSAAKPPIEAKANLHPSPVMEGTLQNGFPLSLRSSGMTRRIH